MAYAITAKGGSVMHAVTGAMDDHRPWRDAVTTMCGRELVAINYYKPEAFRKARERGKTCIACTKAAEAAAMLSTVVIRQVCGDPDCGDPTGCATYDTVPAT